MLTKPCIDNLLKENTRAGLLDEDSFYRQARLIDFYEERGGDESGFMRDVGGETRGLLDPKMKRRRDETDGSAPA